VLGLEGADRVDRQQVVRVGSRLGAPVDHDGRPDQPGRRALRNVLLVATGDPVVRGVEVRSDVLATLEPVPVPGRAALVVAADLVHLPARGVGERRRKLDDRRGFGERLGEVDDLDRAGRERVDEGGQGVHATSFWGQAGGIRVRDGPAA
jgi:hypothetical protein